VSLCLSVSLCLCVSVYESLCLCVFLSLSLCVPVIVCVTVSLCRCVSVSLCLRVSVSLCLSVSVTPDADPAQAVLQDRRSRVSDALAALSKENCVHITRGVRHRWVLCRTLVRLCPRHLCVRVRAGAVLVSRPVLDTLYHKAGREHERGATVVLGDQPAQL
jgi:hypothetical protein